MGSISRRIRQPIPRFEQTRTSPKRPRSPTNDLPQHRYIRIKIRRISQDGRIHTRKPRSNTSIPERATKIHSPRSHGSAYPTRLPKHQTESHRSNSSPGSHFQYPPRARRRTRKRYLPQYHPTSAETTFLQQQSTKYVSKHQERSKPLHLKQCSTLDGKPTCSNGHKRKRKSTTTS